MKKIRQKVFVGLSGGVDSSVAAALLLRQGYQVIGVYMKNWTENVGSYCCSTDQDAMDARLVAQKLDIPFYIWNFEQAYKNEVMSYFFSEYKAGRTPNPDILCNREIKFKLFLNRALTLGADFVATGHYARIFADSHGYHLLKGVDANKDQSYFLCALGQKELKHSLFPIGDLHKPEVRCLAAEYQLSTAAKKDSQGLCFVGKINVREFLREKIGESAGAVVTTAGEILGRHQGLAFYTIGQRTGLTMLANGPWYVVDKAIDNNLLVVSRDANDPRLWRRRCHLTNWHWVNQPAITPTSVQASLRYRQSPADARLINDGDTWSLEFVEPQRAITPGQWAAIYTGDELLASAVIQAAD